MAYDLKEIEETAIKAIMEHNLFFMEDVIAYVPCGKVTFYEHKLNELNTIKELLEQNKINQKVKLRKFWGTDDSAPVLQIALYKLIGTDDESDRINSQKIKTDQNIKHELPISDEEKTKIIDNL